MNDVYEQIKFITNTIWQRRSYALAVAWFVCLAGWIVVATMPNAYKSSARIFIDTSNALRPLLKGLAIETDIAAQLELMRRTLTSRANMANVARLTDLDLTASTPHEMESLLQSLKSRTQIKLAGPKLLTISFIDSDPARARDVTEALITTFIEMNLGHGREDLDTAQQFLDTQILTYENNLQEAELRLVIFKQEKLNKLPNQVNAERRIEALRSERLEGEANLRRAIARRGLLRQQLESPGVATQDPRVEKLEDSLRDLLSRYTEQHPEVIALRRMLKALREEQERPAMTELGETDANLGSVQASQETNSLSAARERIKIDLSQQKTDIAFYKGRVSRIINKVGKLELALARIPEVQAELTRLNRDYEVLRSNYGELVGRREQAKLSRERDIRADDIKFRILDPPRVPGSPIGPSRSLLLAVSLLGGIGAGVVFALLLGLLGDTVSDPEQLRQAFGLPILGMVSIIDSFKNRGLRVAQSSAFFGALALLFVVFAGLITVERQAGLASLASNKHINAAYEGVGTASGKLKAVIAELIERI